MPSFFLGYFAHSHWRHQYNDSDSQSKKNPMRKPRASIEEGESAIKVRNALYEPWEKAQTKKKRKDWKKKGVFQLQDTKVKEIVSNAR